MRFIGSLVYRIIGLLDLLLIIVQLIVYMHNQLGFNHLKWPINPFP